MTTTTDPYAARSLGRTTEVSAFRRDGKTAVVIGGTCDGRRDAGDAILAERIRPTKRS